MEFEKEHYANMEADRTRKASTDKLHRLLALAMGHDRSLWRIAPALAAVVGALIDAPDSSNGRYIKRTPELEAALDALALYERLSDD